jgi:hypothetical protein
VDRLDAPTSAEDNVVSHNVANGRFDDGILVGPGSRETLAERNVAFGSGDDGRHHERRLAPPWHILALIER